jgi:hypothetical protein
VDYDNADVDIRIVDPETGEEVPRCSNAVKRLKKEV